MKADLGLISEAKRVAEDIRVRAGAQGIDYLILSQGVSRFWKRSHRWLSASLGGPPNGKFVPTTESHDQHYVVQVVSRFILAYQLALYPGTASSVVKKGIMSIMSPGRTMQNTDYDDLELLDAKKRGKHSLVAVFSRNSNVVDAFTEVRRRTIEMCGNWSYTWCFL